MLIVIAILGILAAIILPEFQSHSQQAKESSAKDTLRILRNVIELYTVQHNNIPPGYPNDDPLQSPSYKPFSDQMTMHHHYLSEIPTNPFNGSRTIKLIGNNEPFPSEPFASDLYGWIYKPATRTIKLNYPGTDSSGRAYFDY